MHDQEHPTKRHVAVMVARIMEDPRWRPMVSAGSVCVEFLLVPVLYGNGALIASVVVHCAAAGAWCLASLSYHSRDDEVIMGAPRRFAGAMLVLFFPLIGYIMTWALVTGVSIIKKRAYGGVYNNFEEYIMTADTAIRTTGEIHDVTDRVVEEVSFEPYIDIIKGGTVLTKKMVIQKLSTIISYDSITLLRKALEDESPEIRLYAAGALHKIENLLNEKLAAALRMVRQRGMYRDLLSAADLYRQYVSAGIAESRLSIMYITEACTLYEKALRISNSQASILHHYAECLVLRADYAAAERVIREALTRWPDDQQLLFLLSEVLFLQRRWPDITAILRGMPSDDYLDEKQKEVVSFWSQTG